jgi:hypothetical protein
MTPDPSSNPQTWKSPFSGKDIPAHHVRREVAVNLAVKEYVFRIFGVPSLNWEFQRDGVLYQSTPPLPQGIIPYPRELANYIKEGFETEHNMAMKHLGIGQTPTSGEIRGQLLRLMGALRQILMLASMGIRWPSARILAIHGCENPTFLENLSEAGIYHVIVWREEHLEGNTPTPMIMREVLGSGTMQVVTTDEAAVLATDASARRPERIRRILHLQEPWEFDSWNGFHPMFDTTE